MVPTEGIRRGRRALTSRFLRTCLERFNRLASGLQSPLLLVIRLYWGGSFFLTGQGKLLHLARTADYFAGLGIPLPRLNVLLAGGTECFGGLLLILGLFSRVASLPLIFTLSVAYLTASAKPCRPFSATRTNSPEPRRSCFCWRC